MKTNLVLLLLIGFTNMLCAQGSVNLKINGIKPEVAAKLKQNKDRISWYTVGETNRVSNNMYVELKNVGEKRTDRGSAGVQANPDAQGLYNFTASIDVELKRTDSTKPISVEIVMPTILGNEVFFIADMTIQELSQPISLDGYMWRATNKRIEPEINLCIEFSSFINDRNLREKYTKNEPNTKLNRSDFTVYLKQDVNAEWVQFNEQIQGSVTNSNSVAMSNKLPSWIDPTKKLFVRFAVKTPLNNFIWGEYSVEPNEYRKESRATHYTSKAFDPNAPFNKPDATPPATPEANSPATPPATPEATSPASPPATPEATSPAAPPATPTATSNLNQAAEKEEKETVKEASTPKSESTGPKVNSIPEKASVKAQPNQPVEPEIKNQISLKSKSGGIPTNSTYESIISVADSLYNSKLYGEAKSKYEEALNLRPTEPHPKNRAEDCTIKLNAIQNKKLPVKRN